ncbi:MAG: hypothetical protein AAFP86_22440, partial [Planctomycetota bacterium]
MVVVQPRESGRRHLATVEIQPAAWRDGADERGLVPERTEQHGAEVDDRVGVLPSLDLPEYPNEKRMAIRVAGLDQEPAARRDAARDSDGLGRQLWVLDGDFSPGLDVSHPHRSTKAAEPTPQTYDQSLVERVSVDADPEGQARVHSVDGRIRHR